MIATQRIAVAPGQTVTWTNKDSVAYAVTKDSRILPPYHDLTDEELMAHLAAGHQEALTPLHSRYAAFIFNLIAQTLDRAAA